MGVSAIPRQFLLVRFVLAIEPPVDQSVAILSLCVVLCRVGSVICSHTWVPVKVHLFSSP